ncbi:MAG TPA: TadE/TadG family type IV pilus assembly protein [Gemmataceae bacterium]|nr:TadE/TadG family type IV pilus assembly protein [Gemmataceae bacterium]
MLIRRFLPRRRRGAVMVEAAIVLSVALLLTLVVIILALGVYRYQQVASLARQAARYASVHGGQYALDTGQPMATQSSIYTNIIQPGAIGMDTSKLSYSVTWDNATELPIYLASAATGQYLRNRVTVTISYTWVPEAYLGSITLTSTSVMEMSY